ncbi:MAG: hypothetical protein ACTHV2_10040, partial [Brachybacterium sp.]
MPGSGTTTATLGIPPVSEEVPNVAVARGERASQYVDQTSPHRLISYRSCLAVRRSDLTIEDAGDRAVVEDRADRA